ncbi:hypothetical protein IT413_05185 [Candidatus Peregrinibacteria bacterium]|nr:hypothetical protein [Candidatus Peregrinibacteria bacterium]
MSKNIYTNRKGSSLLVAILVMGILMTITLGLSSLIIREINQTGDVVAAGMAYYSAEAGVENALLDLREHLPGYQTKGLPQAVALTDSGVKEWITQTGVEPDYQYNIRNKGNAYPYFDADVPIYLEPGVGVTKKFLYEGSNEDALEATYNVLPLSDTVTIPLFSDCGDGTFEDVQDFVLQYYVNFEADESVKLAAKQLEDFDILRWKVFGTPTDGDATVATRTHAISDFFPAATGNSAAHPVCIGSSSELTDGCILPVAKYVTEGDTIEDLGDVWSQARQCYVGDAGNMVTSGLGIKKGCTIKDFIFNHKKNYLTITNIVNPDIVGVSNPQLRDKRANIYYRILAKRDVSGTTCVSGVQADEDVMPREYAHIRSDGFSSDGKVKQSIDVNLKLNNFLPVFNFSLYHTDPNKLPELTLPLLPGFPFQPLSL